MEKTTITKNIDLDLDAITTDQARLTSITRIQEDLKRLNRAITEPILDLQKQIQASMAPVIRLQESMQEMSEMWSQALQITPQYLEKWKEIVQKIKDQDEQERTILKKANWILSPIMLELPISVIRKAMYDYEKGEEDTLFQLVRSTYRYKKFQALELAIERWAINKYFEPRMHLIKQAIKAHKRGEYGISIPTFLNQIEGISGSICNHIGITVSIKDVKQKVIKAISKGDYYHKDVINSILDNLVYIHTDHKKFSNNGTELNRNAISHGISYQYDTEENSYRCIQLLDVLSIIQKS